MAFLSVFLHDLIGCAIAVLGYVITLYLVNAIFKRVFKWWPK